ncbi:hypothetical protein HQ865_25635 [Mucilaginibacter mali]|jgi:hypothetical protein|uniref:Uncharacterized protein n=1 Tax=Mucilaginibacter mali TaxID=2740462 RepID=A0A7D4PX26_9SPHI|nr:hypothetical protein [Mucilaginibacter mali]QKJ32988.1 hypothetical protein HQ865_25635 [Mucilaginibacter mali]
MSNLPPDTELETELQELYILARHWQDDISFLADEARFFRNILLKYDATAVESIESVTNFRQKIEGQESQLVTLRSAVPEFLAFLEPYIGDNKKAMDLTFLERYNDLQNGLTALFAGIKKTKKELFAYAETVMAGNLTTVQS